MRLPRNNLQAGTVSGSHSRQTEDGRHREYEVDNSNLDSLFVKQVQEEGRDFSFFP